jgi:glycosyltransferase involved in cell wall biosynthesis
VSVADSMTEQALAAGIGHPDQFQTVYSGMDVEPYLSARDDRGATRDELGLAHDDRVIGTVARLAELKGHDDLLDGLAPRLKRDPPLKLLWVGDGWWRERLTRRARELGLLDRIVMTGLVPPADVPRMMRAMDLLVHPSYHEGLPRTLPQALLSGVPVVAYDTDGSGEVCRDGQTGKLAPTGDARALADTVEWMIDHPDERRAMARRGRDFCAARFDHRQMIRQLQTIYEAGAPAAS